MSFKQLTTLATSMSAAFLKKIGVTNAKASSPRSLLFDIAPTKLGINRIKVTETEGTATIQFLQVTEVDLVAGVPISNIEAVITAYTQLSAEPAPMTSIEAVLAAFTKTPQ